MLSALLLACCALSLAEVIDSMAEVPVADEPVAPPSTTPLGAFVEVPLFGATTKRHCGSGRVD